MYFASRQFHKEPEWRVLGDKGCRFQEYRAFARDIPWCKDMTRFGALGSGHQDISFKRPDGQFREGIPRWARTKGQIFHKCCSGNAISAGRDEE
jgi:hypothetical protein